MSPWPGWNSAEDAHWWSSFFFWLGAASFLILGASGIVSHVYGLRRDHLVGVDGAGRLAAVTGEPAATQAGEVRTLSAAQKDAIEKACKPFPGQRFELQSMLDDRETVSYRDQLEGALVGAGWKADTGGVPSGGHFSKMPVGIVFILNKFQVEQLGNSLPAAIQELIIAMHESGVIPSVRSVVLDNGVPMGSVRLVIGAPPPSR